MSSDPFVPASDQSKEIDVASLDISALASRVGGHFHLCTLVTKRALELMGGSRRLTDVRSKRRITTALAEVEETKIELLTPEEARRRLLGGDDTDDQPVEGQ